MRGILAFLTASQALFLWMFLATDPLEQVAEAPGLLTEHAQRAATGFAAAWRHGMAGNSPLYLPGFFLTAAAVWMHAARRGSLAQYAVQVVSTALIALAVATLLAPWGADQVLRAFAGQHPVRLPDNLEPARVRTAAIGLYTLFTWAVFVVSARAALVRRSWYPFLVPASLTLILIKVRPWTADDFTRFWAMQVREGDSVAWVSLLTAIALATALVRSERHSRRQRSHSHAPSDRA